MRPSTCFRTAFLVSVMSCAFLRFRKPSRPVTDLQELSRRNVAPLAVRAVRPAHVHLVGLRGRTEAEVGTRVVRAQERVAGGDVLGPGPSTGTHGDEGADRVRLA